MVHRGAERDGQAGAEGFTGGGAHTGRRDAWKGVCLGCRCTWMYMEGL